MAEPSLSCAERAAETYRFVWLRTFDAPVAIRVESAHEAVLLTSVTLSGAGGYDPGTVVERSTRSLSLPEWNMISDALNQARFWATASWAHGNDGFDGSQWIVEGRAGSKYHLIDRWSPKSGSFYELGLLFLRLSRLDVPAEKIY
jgi:hypothetical protein